MAEVLQMIKQPVFGVKQHQIRTKYRIEELEAELNYLRNLVKTQADEIADLQSRVDPYSDDGRVVCNSF